MRTEANREFISGPAAMVTMRAQREAFA